MTTGRPEWAVLPDRVFLCGQAFLFTGSITGPAHTRKF